MSQCRVGLRREWYIRRNRRRLDGWAVIDIGQDTVNFVIEYTSQTEGVTFRLISMGTTNMRLGKVRDASLGCGRGMAACSY